MSDAAIANIVTGLVTITTIITGFLALWVKLRYGQEKVDDVSRKVDDNTNLTSKVKTSADKASQHVEGCDKRMEALNNKFMDHDSRIASVERKLNSVQSTTDTLGRNIDATRNELITMIQTLFNKLDLIVVDNNTIKKEPR